MAARGTLTLVAPGLLCPALPAGADRAVCEAVTAGLAVPALETLLTRGGALDTARTGDGEADDVTGLLFRLFGYRREAGYDWPAGAVSLLGEGREPGDACWLRADPVYLKPDLSDLVLIEPDTLEVSSDDALGLIEALADHFATDGLHFDRVAPERWYLSLPEPPRVVTRSPSAVAGRAISSALPGGADGSRWHRLMNESQMLLHECKANRARAARGLVPINSVWPWGFGAVPARPGPAPFAGVFGDGPLLRGLAACAGIDCSAGAGTLLGAPLERDVLVLESGAHAPARALDVERWRAAVTALEQAWLAPALGALGRGRLQALELWSDAAGGHRITRRDARRWWRRRVPIVDHVERSLLARR